MKFRKSIVSSAVVSMCLLIGECDAFWPSSSNNRMRCITLFGQDSINGDPKDSKPASVESDIVVEDKREIPKSIPMSSTKTLEENEIGERILLELKEASDAIGLAFTYFSKKVDEVTPEIIVKLCDEIDMQVEALDELKDDKLITQTLELKKKALEFGRYHFLVKLMKKDYEAYVATAGFLSPSRIARLDLPNVQDVKYNDIQPSRASETNSRDELVDDCTLEDKKFNDNFLDKLLLNIFRDLVEENTGGVSSTKPGIEGLLDQGRSFMLQPNQTPEAQHKMVKDTLGGLMTPVLPPFYRIFMSGIVPKLGTEYDGKQIGPWFYAPCNFFWILGWSEPSK